MKRLFLALIVPFFISGEPLKLDISAKAAILMNADTGTVLYEKNGYQSVYPASITKVATALYVLEKKGHALDEMATATRDCFTIASKEARLARPCLLQADGTMMGLRVGEILPLKILLYGLMISSGNDAANTLGRHISGSPEEFVDELNRFLKEKGIVHTHFRNPHGLHHPDHMTTAYDMAQMTSEALKYPLFREIVKTVKFSRPATNVQKGADLIQGNKLLKKGKYYYPKAIGVKTGYTDPAGFTMIAAAQQEGRTLVAVLLGCPSFDNRYRDAIKMFETAFKEKEQSRTFFTQEHDHFWLELKKGKRSLEAALGEDLCLTYFPAEEPKVKTQIKWNTVKLPIREGQAVGHLELVTEAGKCVKSAPLFAVRGVEKTLWASASDACRAYKTLFVTLALCLFVLAGLFYLLKKPKKVV